MSRCLKKGRRHYKNTDQLENTVYRLGYHFMAPSGWLNDPNGLIQHKGIYHLFYQHHPYSADWGPMHWGHATSKDLITWQHESIALAPSETYEYEAGKTEIGCFSGSAVINGEELVLIYTGHVEGREPKEVQAAATSSDGIHFTKNKNNPIIAGPSSELSDDFRDPKVWKYENTWYMVVGTSKGENGAAALYSSKNLEDWNYTGTVLEGDGTQGDMWECPDLFPIGEKHALIVSPMNMENGKNIIIVGEMDYASGTFIPETSKEIDEGIDFYAAQTFADEKGRRILIAWMDTWDTDFPTKKEGWAGAMTIPREITLDSGNHPVFLPVPEMKELRIEHERYQIEMLKADSVRNINSNKNLTNSFEIQTEIKWKKEEGKGRVGFILRASNDRKEQTLVYYDIEKQKLVVDTTNSGESSPALPCEVSLKREDSLALQIFIDTSSIEVFTEKGDAVITNRIYPNPSHIEAALFTTKTDIISTTVDTWNLKKVIK
ncbi:glycoside hydrolase family 32 protein [Sinobaca sp. H24]|uniref:glycoside hydrolase family 32 protein n=1 Tax=Sinobaca sp. H24 TaxID=2923376 RepID=UPI00207AAF3E|nr:glycoside hydrolase family 32 protein [Sinobaca sp. H24]